ncbi:MAG: MarR family winged helix-turn-helix transcriptional regulator [Kangiellaceae bacterium]
MSVSKLDDQLCFALYSASSQVTKIYRPLLERLGLTYTQFLVLMALWQKDNVSISQLAVKVGLSKATMTPLLKRLEQKELILRETLNDNERQKNIVLTDKGKNMSEQSGEITDKAFCSTGLSKKQADTIIEICGQIVRNAEG